MQLLRVRDLVKRYGDRAVLDGVSLDIEAGQCAALVGPNGCGKSTLLKIVVGELEPGGGDIRYLVSTEPRLGYLPQQYEPAVPGETVWQYALRAFEHLERMGKRLEELELALGDEDRNTDELLDEYGSLQDRFRRLGGYDYEVRLRAALDQVGVDGSWLERPAVTLSGGEKTRVGLAQLLAVDCTFMLLDEPTNHLDIETLEWLEEFIHDFRGTVLVVSHDRHFLDEVAQVVFELRDGKLRTYHGNYSAYREQKEGEEKRAWEEWLSGQKRVRRLEEAMRRQQAWAESAHVQAGINDHYRRKAKKMALRAKAQITRLQRLIEEEPDKPDIPSTIKLEFEPPARHGRRIMEARGLGLSFDTEPLFRGLSFSVQSGDNVAIVGPNGSGKTSLLRVMVGELRPTWGELWVTETARLGYLRQELEGLDPSVRVLDALRAATAMTVGEARNMLAQVLLRGDDVFRSAGSLSLGERMRLSLAILIARGADVLLLDEPTNHLDLDSREQVEQALSLFEGTVVIVSHDRYLLERFAERIIALEDGVATVHELPYEAYRNRVRQLEWLEGRGATGDLTDFQSLQADALILERRLAGLGADLDRAASAARATGAPPETEELDRLEREYQETSHRLQEVRKRLADFPGFKED